jgi:hypothetical protein
MPTQWYTVARLSDHMETTPEGFLLIRDVPVARCGVQLYRQGEINDLDANDHGWIEIDREPSEVFKPDSIASFQGKPIVNDHPSELVNPSNYSSLAIGHMSNPHRGENADHDLLLCDLLFTTDKGINLVRGGKRALSVGYTAFYQRTGRGLGRQYNIVCNHTALVDEGRCGGRCTIMDGAAVYNYEGSMDGSFEDDRPGWHQDIDWSDAWIESEHPRGQPKNKGEFAKTKGGGGVGAGAYGLARKAGGAVKEAGHNFTKHDHKILMEALHEPGSAPRKRIAHHVRAVGKALPHLLKSHLKEEKHHAVGAAKALKSLATGKRPEPEHWRGLRAFGTRILMVAGSMALTGDPTGTVGHLAGAIAHEVVQHVVGEHAIQLGASGARAAVSKWMGGGGTGTADQDSDALSAEDYELLAEFIDQLADAAENMGFSDDDMAQLLTEKNDRDGAAGTVVTDAFEEGKHPRGQPDNKGEFAKGAGGGGSIATAKGKVGKLTEVKKRAFEGEPVTTKTKLSKTESGAIGEAVITQWLQKHGLKDARALNLERSNYPVDLIGDHQLIEAKAGLVSNGPSAQKWRATIGQPSKTEQAWLAKAKPEAKAAYNQKKMKAIMDRKMAVVKEYEKKLGRKITPRTVTTIINPDTRTADLYSFEGFHHHIRWNNEKTEKAYVGSYRY